MTGAFGPAEFETLIDWVDGRLTPERAEQVEAQLAHDERHRALADWLRSFVKQGKDFPLQEPPPIIRQRLRSHFERWRETEHAIRDEIERFDASVLFDSRRESALVGMRGAVVDDVLHIAFTTAAADLVLDIARLPGRRVRIDGQVLPLGPPMATVFEATASGPGFTLRTVDGDDFGRFRLDEVPDDADELQVTNGIVTLVAALDLHIHDA